ncbi:30S ribosomal protein S9 [Candidatus Micrarchaeota archaeon]|nr:30S ribosomal protein S9 [Candidatus Micrarchaeota archaeon]
MTRGKRKRAIARAVVKPGKGLVRVNGLAVSAFTSRVEREVITEPLEFVDKKYDAEVKVSGGGRMGQAQAIRTAIAKALYATTQDEELKNKMLNYDRTLLVEDTRRVEPKKFKGPKARARFTKSYR